MLHLLMVTPMLHILDVAKKAIPSEGGPEVAAHCELVLELLVPARARARLHLPVGAPVLGGRDRGGLRAVHDDHGLSGVGDTVGK